ncbi:hypothetical protein BV25DRAFT_1821535 [Artomyces pyxidatus]|uniref:Uncharacterized protein n=1 Tax=Artomyces pyxidatus TaxID=48021 RepID=A0ACB8TCB6_9AGAM|nr:hypothetical protein BV25DRAFT_1821535 [Artomyces pyxidatus]
MSPHPLNQEVKPDIQQLTLSTTTMRYPAILPALTRPLVSSRVHSVRPFHSTQTFLEEERLGRDPTVSQGHLASSSNRQQPSVQSEYARAGRAATAKSNEHPYDSASPNGVRKAPRTDKERGNPEQIGFADQVGGQSAYDRRVEEGEGDGGRVGGRREATPPGFFSAVKQALGFGTSSGDVKQNRGAGGGVTGTGTFKSQEDR